MWPLAFGVLVLLALSQQEKKIVKVLPRATIQATPQPGRGILTNNPCPGSRRSSKFGYRIHPISKVRKHHNGIDMSAVTGTPIFAAGDGLVIVSKAAQGRRGYGNHVVLDHGGGLTTKYGHMVNLPLVQVGQRVKAGQLLGYVGSTGYSTGPHLHFEVRRNNVPVDPVAEMPFLEVK